MENALMLDVYKAGVLFRGELEQEGARLHEENLSRFLNKPQNLITAAALYENLDLYPQSSELNDRALFLANLTEHNGFYWRKLLDQAITLNRKNEEFRQAALLGEALILIQLNEAFSTQSDLDQPASHTAFNTIAQTRFKTDLCWIEHELRHGNRQRASILAQNLCKQWQGHGQLADELYPLMRQHQLHSELSASVSASYNIYLDLLKAYPKGHNHKNTAAWLASRAGHRIDHAGQLLAEALAYEPRNAAFLDTTAEIYFEKGNREKALEYSLRAWHNSHLLGDAAMIKLQYYHFLNDPLPNP